jgi:hypothetical protein
MGIYEVNGLQIVNLAALQPTYEREPAHISAETTDRNDQLLKLIDTVDLPESVKAAYLPGTVSLFHSGLPATDARYHEGALELRITNITDYNQRINDIYGDGSFSFELDKIPKDDRYILQPSAALLTQAIRQSKIIQEKGLLSCPGVGIILSTVQFLYYPIADTVWELDKQPVEIPESDLEILYGTDFPESVSLAEIAERVHTNQELDFSKETLDQRFEAFVGLLNLDLSRMVLLGLSELHFTRGAISDEFTKSALQHKDVILSDDLLAKQQILYELGKRYSSNTRGTNLQKKAAVLQGSILGTLAQSSKEFLQYFKNIYTGLGYELPALLTEAEQPPVAETPTPPPALARAAGQKAISKVTATVEVPAEEIEEIVETKPTASPEVIEEINTLKTELSGRIEEADRPWRLSKKRQKGLELDTLQDRLRNGAYTTAHVEGMGDWTPLAPMTADRVALLLGTLSRITEVGQSDNGREAVQQLLENAAETHRQLIEATEILGAYADNAHHASYSRPNRPHNPIDSLQYVADYWHIFSDLLQTTGPQNFAGNVWQYLPEPRPTSRYAALLREYQSYAQNAEPIIPV